MEFSVTSFLARRVLPVVVSLSSMAWESTCHGATIIASGDSYIQGGASAAVNYGTSGNITVKYTGTSVTDTSRIGYLYFLPGELEGTVESASLNLTVTINDTGVGTTPWTVQVYALVTESKDNWTESGITWQNSPGHDSTSTGFNSDALYLGDVSIPAGVTGGTYSFSNAALVGFLNADTDGRVTFMLTRTSSPTSGFNLAFASRNHETVSSHPSLTYTLVPEPGKALLLGMAGMAWLLVRRR
jgi:hypothetical protein